MTRGSVFATAWILLAVGCVSSPTDEGPPRYPLAPNWHYGSEQRAPDQIRTEGDVRVTFQTGTRFDGLVDVVETSQTGARQRRTGIISGRFRDSLSVDFDMRLEETDVRRHVGRIFGDTIRGEWAQSGGNGIATGTFQMERRP